jgi:hypothetical protein
MKIFTHHNDVALAADAKLIDYQKGGNDGTGFHYL